MSSLPVPIHQILTVAFVLMMDGELDEAAVYKACFVALTFLLIVLPYVIARARQYVAIDVEVNAFRSLLGRRHSHRERRGTTRTAVQVFIRRRSWWQRAVCYASYFFCSSGIVFLPTFPR